MSQIEVIRRACHAMSTQSFTSHLLKRLKLLAILGSVLILWGGFLSNAHATQWVTLHGITSDYTDAYIYQNKTIIAADDETKQARFRAFVTLANRLFPEGLDALSPGWCNLVISYGNPDYQPSYLFDRQCYIPTSLRATWYARTCNEPSPYAAWNGVDLVCTDVDPNPPPPLPPPIPPESSSKNFGSGPECPSPYVADKM